jgi:hypothetical protein
VQLQQLLDGFVEVCRVDEALGHAESGLRLHGDVDVGELESGLAVDDQDELHSDRDEWHQRMRFLLAGSHR